MRNSWVRACAMIMAAGALVTSANANGGRVLYVADGDAATTGIYIMDADTGLVTGNVTNPVNLPDGISLSIDGQSMFVVDGDQFRHIALGGSPMASWTQMGTNVEGIIAISDQTLVLCDALNQNISFLDIGTQQITSSFSPGLGNPSAIDWNGGNELFVMFMSSATTIYRFDMSGTQLGTVTLGAALQNPLGMAYTGTGFFVGDANNDTIYEFDLNGTLLNSFNAPGNFTEALEWGGGINANTSDGGLKVSKASYKIDWKARANAPADGVSPVDSMTLQGTVNLGMFIENGVALSVPQSLNATVTWDGQVFPLGPGVGKGSNLQWETPQRNDGFFGLLALKFNVKKGSFRITGREMDLTGLGGGIANDVQADTQVAVPFSVCIGSAIVSGTLNTLYNQKKPDVAGKGQYQHAKAGYSTADGIFLVTKAKIQQRTVRDAKGSLEMQRASFSICFSAPNASTVDFANGASLGLGMFVENVGDGSQGIMFENKGTKFTYSNRDPAFPAAVRSMTFDGKKWFITVQTDWVLAGTFGSNLALNDLPNEPVTAWFPVTLDVDGVLFNSGIRLTRKGSTWSN